MIHSAIEFAAKAHEGQTRKGTNLPYIVHPMETAMILAQSGAKEKLICAGLLHDTLEDTDTTKEELEKIFGCDVAELVAARSENKENSWEERKQHTIDTVHDLEPDGLLLLCADKLSNIRSIATDYKQLGEELWNRFNRGKKYQKWYYKKIIEELSLLEDEKMYRELQSLYKEVFEDTP